MFQIVFSKEDRDLLISQGCTYMGEQQLDKTVYIFKKNNNVNFEQLNIETLETNEMFF